MSSAAKRASLGNLNEYVKLIGAKTAASARRGPCDLRKRASAAGSAFDMSESMKLPMLDALNWVTAAICQDPYAPFEIRNLNETEIKSTNLLRPEAASR